jgi:hypothetical protein
MNRWWYVTCTGCRWASTRKGTKDEVTHPRLPALRRRGHRCRRPLAAQRGRRSSGRCPDLMPEPTTNRAPGDAT